MNTTSLDNTSPLKHPKRLLAVFLPIVAFITISACAIYWIERERQHARHAHDAHEAVSLSLQPISRTIQAITRDLRYLADDVVMQQVLDNPTEERLATLAADWMSFSRNKQVYDKIRWIDQNGIERLRINYGRPRIIRVPASELEDKAKRYFFSDAFKLNAGEIFVSPLDLNVDKNEIELPYKPTIRLGTPVFDSRGRKRGILLINYLAVDLLATFDKSFRKNNQTGWLLNNDGYWLSGGNPDENFAFMFGRTEASLAHRYPEAWQHIQAANSGQFVTREGFWAFNTVVPLAEGQKTTTGSFEILSASRTRIDSRKYAWKTVYLMPMSVYDAGMSRFAFMLTGAAFTLLTLFFIGAWRLVRSQLVEKELRENLEKIVETRTQALSEVNEKLTDDEARLRTLMKTLPDLQPIDLIV
ncbi:MAG: hypothetical protein C4516_04430 [Oxalobacter sp.]|nr:MAG: hypothetical protein C4516_04430 [Oxalobacter sp.]